MRCKQPDFNVQLTVQRCNNYSTVLFIIQCDTVIYTALCCKQNTIVSVIFTVLYWRLCCQYSTVNFTIFFFTVYNGALCRLLLIKKPCSASTMFVTHGIPSFSELLRGGGGLILHVCQYVFQNHLKSRKIIIHVGYADIIILMIS